LKLIFGLEAVRVKAVHADHFKLVARILRNAILTMTEGALGRKLDIFMRVVLVRLHELLARVVVVLRVVV